MNLMVWNDWMVVVMVLVNIKTRNLPRSGFDQNIMGFSSVLVFAARPLKSVKTCFGFVKLDAGYNCIEVTQDNMAHSNKNYFMVNHYLGRLV